MPSKLGVARVLQSQRQEFYAYRGPSLGVKICNVVDPFNTLFLFFLLENRTESARLRAVLPH